MNLIKKISYFIYETAFFTIFFIILIFAGYSFITYNDLLSFCLIVLTALLMSYKLRKIYFQSRKIASIYFKKDSFLYNFFNKKTKLVILVAIIASVVFSFSFYGVSVLMLKENEYVFIFSLFVSVLIVNYLSKLKINQKILSNNLSDPIVEYSLSIFQVIMISLVVNAIISIIYSYADFKDFYINDINLSNFTDKAYDESIKKVEHNDIFRKIFNIFILLDSLKKAITNAIIDTLFGRENINKIFLIFFIYVTNLFKFFTFSFSIVIMHMSLHNILQKLFKKLLVKIEKYIKERKIYGEKSESNIENEIS